MIKVRYKDLGFRGKLKHGFKDFGTITSPGRADCFCSNPVILKKVQMMGYDFEEAEERNRLPIPITLNGTEIWCQNCTECKEAANAE